MRKKIETILLMIIFIINICFISKVYAVDLCTLNASFNEETTNPGKDIVLTLSTTSINGGVSGINVTLEYDESILELTGFEKVDGWTVMQTENSFTLVTDSSEETTTVGNIGKIKLKVKENVEETKTNIKLTSVQATKDGSSVEDLGDISKELNIVKPTNNTDIDDENNTDTNTDTDDENNNDTNTDTDDENNNNTNTDTDNENNNNTNTDTDKENNNGTNTDGENNSDTSNYTNNENNNVNDNINDDSNNNEQVQSNIEDNSNLSDNTTEKTSAKTQSLKLPYTGNLSFGIGSVLIIAIVAGLSYMKYIKYKDIK